MTHVYLFHTDQHNDSSDEMEYAAAYQGRPKQLYMVKRDDGMFSPSGDLLLSEDQEDWDLFSEITACYQSKARKNASTDSYDLLEEEGSFCSIDSICSLDPARNRCSSEPSVCLSSQLPANEGHEPVARQSSCDATIMHSHSDYIRRLKQLQLESQKLIDEGLSPGLSRVRQNFRGSPLSGAMAKKLIPQKTSLSNRSSFSSLSSTTTSPSASSLSSLDSAFSYCSESSAFSPSDVSSLPFMFGTSARLHALSPKIAKKSSKVWHKPVASPLLLNPCSLDLCIENMENDQEARCSRGEEKGFIPIDSIENLLGEDMWSESKEEARHAESLSQGSLQSHCCVKSDYTAYIPDAEGSSLTAQQAQRETSVKHIEIRGPEAAARSQESLKRTKITVYMAPKERSPRASPLGQDSEDVASSSDGSSNNPSVAFKSLQTVKVHIPQTVFYGQNTPLVLQSVSRRYHHEAVSRPPQVTIPQNAPLLEEPSHPAQQAACIEPPSHRSGNAFSHTFRFFLPASIRNTVRDYFSHDGSKGYCAANAEAVENELIRSKAEWLRSTTAPPEEHNNLLFTEETFV